MRGECSMVWAMLAFTSRRMWMKHLYRGFRMTAKHVQATACMHDADALTRRSAAQGQMDRCRQLT